MTDLQIPEYAPAPGFYYHYKHDPSCGETHMAYQVAGVGWHTETGEYEVLYRPLYDDSQAYTGGKMMYVRPLGMFIETIEKPGYTGARFTKVDDPEVAARLLEVQERMYGSA